MKKFITAVTCIDGRVQIPLIEFSKKKFDALYVDLITEPGPDKILSENKNISVIKSIKRKISVSVEKHCSNIIIIAGHYDCAANPVSKKEHLIQIQQAADNIKKWNFPAEIYKIWINKDKQAYLL